jgi:Flp pilus assembly protein TadD
MELEPKNQELVNDLGWTLFRAGRFAQARETLERAVSMDPSDELAAENLRLCMREIARRRIGKAGNSQAARRGPGTLR